GEMMLDRMPIVRNVYRALKQIFESAVSAVGPQTFQKVGLIEFPSKGLWSGLSVTGRAVPVTVLRDYSLAPPASKARKRRTLLRSVANPTPGRAPGPPCPDGGPALFTPSLAPHSRRTLPFRQPATP
ncbi:MAG: DUF502 domain-containing protein, partial [Gemmataceae bacterium]|nr:DUF502 domain-containing protein [Gemmataceae bacterium]